MTLPMTPRPKGGQAFPLEHLSMKRIAGILAVAACLSSAGWAGRGRADEQPRGEDPAKNVSTGTERQDSAKPGVQGVDGQGFPVGPGFFPGGLPGGEPPEYPPFPEVMKGHEKVTSTTDGAPSMWGLWVRRKDGHVFAELPGDYLMRKYFIALTVASGEVYAGLQAGDTLVYWRQYDKRLALIQPNVEVRSSGDQESQSSVKRLFTDRVLFDVPIVTMGTMGGPVIDLSGTLIGNAYRFFGPSASISNPTLISLKTVKAFPQNIEVSFEAPMNGGILKSLHFSISVLNENSGYRPRVADTRIGYFTTGYDDYGKFTEDETRIRFINRWHLEKRDPSLKLSPPRNPLVFYIEHTTPVRYRPYVKKGILAWNQAFEKIGLREAIEVRQQDATTGEHMSKDPEDVNYNFVRWLNNNISTAIGPSRTNPYTGEILDADIVLTDGWIRHYLEQNKEVLPSLAMEGFGPNTLAWLEQNPTWDPRVLLAPPSERAHMVAERTQRGPEAHGGHALGKVDSRMIGDDEFDGLVGRHSQCNGMCMFAHGLAVDMAMLRMHIDALTEEGTPPAVGDVLDGMPEEFIGPLLAELVAHEVGHTLGLRHNFKASSIYSLADINSAKVKGKPFAGSVMDYLPINIDMKDGEMQGDYTMTGIGPYDMWAIEYGYTFDENLKPIVDRVAEPELQYSTDEDTIGADPLAMRYDFSANPLDYAKSQMKLAKYHRERMLEKFVKDGDSWAKTRKGYYMTLNLQFRSVANMSDWIGGAFVHRDKKGDKNGRAPIEVVPAQQQREALDFVIANAFQDDAFGLTPDLLKHLSADEWLDGDFFSFDDPVWAVHDTISGIQSSILTRLLNPNTLELVYDNELRTPSDVDMVTLPEVLDKVGAAIWTEMDKAPTEQTTARKPWISSLRRNLQRTHLARLIDLSMPDRFAASSSKPIATLALARLRALKDRFAACLAQPNIDPYSAAHLAECQVRTDKALEASYIYNIKDASAGASFGNQFFQPADK